MVQKNRYLMVTSRRLSRLPSTYGYTAYEGGGPTPASSRQAAVPRPVLKHLGRTVPERRHAARRSLPQNKFFSRGKQHAAPAAASLKSGSLLRRPALYGPAKQRRPEFSYRQVHRQQRQSRSLSDRRHRSPKHTARPSLRCICSPRECTLFVGSRSPFNSRRTDSAGLWPRTLRVGHALARALLPRAVSLAFGRTTTHGSCRGPASARR